MRLPLMLHHTAFALDNWIRVLWNVSRVQMCDHGGNASHFGPASSMTAETGPGSRQATASADNTPAVLSHRLAYCSTG